MARNFRVFSGRWMRWALPGSDVGNMIGSSSLISKDYLTTYRTICCVIVSSQIYDRYGAKHRVTRAYQKLFELCPMVKEFEPEEGRLQGPTIRVLRVLPESGS